MPAWLQREWYVLRTHVFQTISFLRRKDDCEEGNKGFRARFASTFGYMAVIAVSPRHVVTRRTASRVAKHRLRISTLIGEAVSCSFLETRTPYDCRRPRIQQPYLHGVLEPFSVGDGQKSSDSPQRRRDTQKWDSCT